MPARDDGFPSGEFFDAISEVLHVSPEPGMYSAELFKSKKHETFLLSTSRPGEGHNAPLPGTFVVKVFDAGQDDAKARESATLASARARGILVPCVVATAGRFLIIEHLAGENASDVINGPATSDMKDDVATKLGTWLADFHHAFSDGQEWTIRGDSNLRNFIVEAGSGVVVGIDLEESGRGDPDGDVLELIDSILITNPGIYTTAVLETIRWKFSLCGSLLDAYFKQMRVHGHAIERDLDDFLDQLIATMHRLSFRRHAQDVFQEQERDLRDMLHHELRSCFIIF